ncbi:nucleotidyltransferase domain-containing protein [Tengunoibacter tsumagoiensis]|uniref:Polymerase beta nucleotidyltransferase domain-containing protein n=1 Tax=Tengunoibacter tsumagoiensis TaxID=2014871 RepID=A0A402AAY6_9CHLR|nr:nucleotidyltransferase domain-containing protein [Tengunoibacter tsumagoiensis]GCE16101.1 hypothetical protein KTT_59600 [Tengunoibacter tsumagoiensis]
MEMLKLTTTTGNMQVDALLRGVIGIFETTFPRRFRSYYLFGSYANGQGRATSDVDLCLVPQGSSTLEERQQFQKLRQYCALISPLTVDMIILDENYLLREGHFRIKTGSRLLLGTDLRSQMPDITLEQYLQQYTQAPLSYLTQVFRKTDVVKYPLTYPDPYGSFYGYDQATLLPSGEPRQNIKGLVSATSWAASILVAWKTHKLVATKSDSVLLYKQTINDQWTGFIEEVYERGNRQWQYLVPQETSERLMLRDLCARMLEFENYFLRCYRDYLLIELDKGTERRQLALRGFQTVSYPGIEKRLAEFQISAS